MPEKVYKKFDDGVKSAEPEQSIAKPENGKKPGDKAHSLKVPIPVNGLKRSQDGKPKTLIANPAPKTTSDLGKTEQIREDADYKDNGRARKSPKLNGAESKTLRKVNGAKPHLDSKPHSNFDGKPQQYGPTQKDLQRTSSLLDKTRKKLPVWLKKMDIRWGLRHHNILLLNGETGSGKSTQVPQFLCTEPWCVRKPVMIENEDGREEEVNVGGMIAITQPRRIAAITLAQRVAAEMGQPLNRGSIKREPGTVGYAVRFDNMVPKDAKIKFVTEGILLQEMLSDPQLRRYSAVIVDEVHERSMDVDLILGFLRKIVHGDLKGRGGVPLKVIIMSATLDKGGIEAFFAKPGSQPDYVLGHSYGKVLATDLPEDAIRDNTEEKFNPRPPHVKKQLEREKNASNGKPGKLDDSRRSSLDSEFSSWSGFSEPTEDTSRPRIYNESEKSNAAKATLPNGVDRKADPETVPDQAGIPKGVISTNGVAYEYIRGRQHEVQTLCEVQPVQDYQHAMLQTILQLHTSEPLPGDILAFLTGQDEIESLQVELEKYSAMLTANVPKLEIKPLHGSLSPEAQQDAFVKTQKKFTRKVVLATNIAETSLTVAGVRYVVDCGKAKVKQYRPHLGMESLLIKPISKVSAIQRAGRAGREAKGKCMRIYTNDEYLKMDQDELPEIMRCNVIEVVLKMKARGVDDVLTFPLMDAPDVMYIEKALNHLYAMDALDVNGALTKVGKQMAKFPLPATHGRVLIAAADASADCLLEVIDVLACLNTDNEIFLQPKSEEENETMNENRSDIYRREGDLITLLTTMQRYCAENTNRNDWCNKHRVSVRAMKLAYTIRKQLRQLCLNEKLLIDIPPADPQPFEPITPDKATVVMKTFLKAFIKETAILGPDGSYKTTVGRETIHIHPSSVLYGKKLEAIMFLQHVFTTKNYAKKVCAIQADWIAEQYGL
jgi:ATP-dependent RNA helicase DHR2